MDIIKMIYNIKNLIFNSNFFLICHTNPSFKITVLDKSSLTINKAIYLSISPIKVGN